LIREIIFFCLISPHLYVEDIQFFSEVLFDELQIAGTHSFRNQSVNTLKKKVKNYGAKDPTHYLLWSKKVNLGYGMVLIGQQFGPPLVIYFGNDEIKASMMRSSFFRINLGK
jgi:hypothetical protein